MGLSCVGRGAALHGRGFALPAARSAAAPALPYAVRPIPAASIKAGLRRRLGVSCLGRRGGRRGRPSGNTPRPPRSGAAARTRPERRGPARRPRPPPRVTASRHAPSANEARRGKRASLMWARGRGPRGAERGKARGGRGRRATLRGRAGPPGHRPPWTPAPCPVPPRQVSAKSLRKRDGSDTVPRPAAEWVMPDPASVFDSNAQLQSKTEIH